MKAVAVETIKEGDDKFIGLLNRMFLVKVVHASINSA